MGQNPPRAVAYVNKVFPLFSANKTLWFHLIKPLENTPEQSQCELSKRCGVSLDLINYCINALLENDYVKAWNFKTRSTSLLIPICWRCLGLISKKNLPWRFAAQAERVWGASTGDHGAGWGSGAVKAVEVVSGWPIGRKVTCMIMGFSVQWGAGMYKVYDGCNYWMR